MAQFHISGGVPLSGSIQIQGAKNAALPLLASSLLTSEPCVFRNVPKIADVSSMLSLLASLGADIAWKDETTVSICCAAVDNRNLDYELVRRLRASALLVGPLLSRFSEVSIPYPGGCLLGKRPLDAHFKAFEALGAEVTCEAEGFVVRASEMHAGRMFLSEASVTATENALMAASCIEGEVLIK
ncbi:MAG TPA: UDP-N-acetylglucosamine 1-carboxyvinyltransferase, partial [bacterium]|nr:UDP-N-acetylglucosamine 1-carboxyvinyltransferase [bacterium]